MPTPTIIWASALLALSAILYLLVSKQALRKRLVAQHHRLQLADAKVRLQETEFIAYKSKSEAALLTGQNQRDTLTAQNRDLLTANNRQRDQIVSLSKQLTNALNLPGVSETGKLTQQLATLRQEKGEVEKQLQEQAKWLLEAGNLTHQLSVVRRERSEAEAQQQELAKRLISLQSEMDSVLQQFMAIVLPIAQRISELTAGSPISLPSASPRQQATILGSAFRQHIAPALDSLAVKLRISTSRVEDKTVYVQYQQRNFYQVADMMGHPFLCLHAYLPTRYQATAPEQAIRNLVYAFKDGVNTVHVVDTLAVIILRSFSAQEIAETLLVVVPASTAAKNENRFKRFCELLSQKTGLVNGYTAIKPTSDRDAFKGQTGVKKTANLSYDSTLIARRKVLLFDDVMTTGASFKQNSQLLIQHGAQQVTGLFLARTVNR
jgi:predicted amidophosphoribosyltransferase